MEMDDIKIIVLSIYKNLDVYDKFSNSAEIHAKPKYRINYANIPNSRIEFTIFDKRFKLNRGMHEVSLARLPKNFIDKLDPNVEIKGDLVELTQPFDVKEEMRKLGLDNLEKWKVWLDNFIDNSGEKDEKLKNIALSHMMPTFSQNLNNHAIFLTNTKSGKTTTYNIITGVPPSTDATYPGLVGSVDRKTGDVFYGLLKGEGCLAIDEFPEMRDPIVNKILDYTETGEVSRLLVHPVQCKGTKTLVFLGNFSEFSPDDFKKNLVGLATGNVLSRVGSRFAHVIYDDICTVKPKPRSGNEQFRRLLIRYSLEKVEQKLRFLCSSREVKEWLFESDYDYEASLMEIGRIVKDSSVSDFIKGCTYSVPRIKMGSLKRAIMDFLPCLVMEQGYKRIFRKLMHKAYHYYDLFKSYNLESLGNIGYDKKLVFNDMVGMNVSKDEIMENLGICEKTYYNWKKYLQAKNCKL
jgi:hypothetical protein